VEGVNGGNVDDTSLSKQVVDFNSALCTLTTLGGSATDACRDSSADADEFVAEPSDRVRVNRCGFQASMRVHNSAPLQRGAGHPVAEPPSVVSGHRAELKSTTCCEGSVSSTFPPFTFPSA